MFATKKRKLSTSVARPASEKKLKTKSKPTESSTKKRQSTRNVSSGSDLGSGSEDEVDSASDLNSDSDGDEGLDPMEMMRKHFESQFAPLEVDKSKSKKRKQEEEETSKSKKSTTTQRAGITETFNDVSEEEYNSNDDGDSDSDSEGWDEDSNLELEEQAPKPVVVDFTNTRIASPPRLTVKARKQLSTAGDQPAKPAPAPSKAKPADDDPLDALNLQNDLSLQRLLKESHLLDSSLELTGKNRHKATAMRIAELATTHGVKTEKREKMPMNMAKGMKKAQESREEKRRREAKEAGIILEKQRKTDTGKDERRDRGLNLNGMGKFRNGALVIGKHEVDALSASVAKSRGGRGGGRGGKGGRGGRGGSRGGKR